MRILKLIVIPTTGIRTLTVEGIHKLVPTRSGYAQLAKAADLLEKIPGTLLVITGGKRRDLERSEAAVYNRAFERLYPSLSSRLLMHVADSKNTVHDMRSLVRRLKRGHGQVGLDDVEKFIIVGHPDHATRAANALHEFAGSNASISITQDLEGEPPYGKWMKLLLGWIDKIDPQWSGPISFLPRIYSEFRAPYYDRLPDA